MKRRPATRDPLYAGYAPYYDLLYDNKNYLAETNFVHEQLAGAGVTGGRLLELGCGTGRHALALTRLGWNVAGYDLSPAMVARARQRARQARAAVRPRFGVGDMGSLRTGSTFDAVISLFHAFCYQATNRQLCDALETVACNLRPGGVFFFDFWYGPAVLTDRPGVRVKRVENKRHAVTRISEPVLDCSRNVVDVRFDVAVENKRSRRVEHIRENHRVRYMFLPELEQLLGAHGLEVRAHGRWMSHEPLDAASWYGWLVARRADGPSPSTPPSISHP